MKILENSGINFEEIDEIMEECKFWSFLKILYILEKFYKNGKEIMRKF